MNTQVTTVEVELAAQDKPGAQLAAVRKQKGYTAEYVAGKLHLRVRTIELLEKDDYINMPEAVFVKGYLRAYANLLDVPVQPLLTIYNNQCVPDKNPEKALWQSRRETNRAEHAVRWLTGVFAVIVLAAVLIWWQANKDSEHLFSASVSAVEPAHNQSETEIRLTDLSKMRSLLSSSDQETFPEKKGG
jgi:cytoskeleton protein RodZ